MCVSELPVVAATLSPRHVFIPPIAVRQTTRRRVTSRPGIRHVKNSCGGETTPRRFRARATAFACSAAGALLCVCSVTLLFGIAGTFAHKPFGLNAGKGAAECSGPEFDANLPVCICPRETVCVKRLHDLIFLVFARASAYFDYPLYVMAFVSKAHNLQGALQRSYLSEFLPVDDLHYLHVFAGTVIGVEVLWHSLWHLIRWGCDGDLSLLWRHQTGLTGLVAFVVTPLIVWPMRVPALRKRLSYELRKWLHYLSVVWGLAACAHAPKRNIIIIMGSAVGIYLLDWLYGFVFRIHHMSTLSFTRLGSAIEVAWQNPPGFNSDDGGYVYLCLPWISRTEWHAFSLVAHPTMPNRSAVCIAVVGDWTRKLHAALSKPCARPGWVYGPFPSPFSTAKCYDNLIAVASGIGVTPSISALVTLSKSRRVNLVWMCRDPDLVEFYLSNVTFDDDAWTFIFYTGKRSLVLSRPANPRVVVIEGRPKLPQLLEAIIEDVVSGLPMPEELVERASKTAERVFGKSPEERFCDALKRAKTTYTTEELFKIAVDASFEVPIDMPSRSTKPTSSMSGGAVRPSHDCTTRQTWPSWQRSGVKGVTLAGFRKMVQTVCKVDGGLTEVQLKEHFATVDQDGSGFIDEDEFGQMLTIMEAKTANMTADSSEKKQKAWSGQHLGDGVARHSCYEFGSRPSIADHRQNVEYFNNVKLYDDWQIMYCGGSKPVIAQLRQFAERQKVSLKVESFDW